MNLQLSFVCHHRILSMLGNCLLLGKLCMFGLTDTVSRQRTQGFPSGLPKAKQILEFSLKITSIHIL